MTRIGLISDTHGYLDPLVFEYFASCDEIWHGGDFGSAEVAAALRAFRPLRGVYGNIDGADIRGHYQETAVFQIEGLKILMLHIGGYPPKYNTRSRQLLLAQKPGLFISGHSHILKIMYDEALGCLHMNPGAAGKQGWHQQRTLIRFSIDGPACKDCEVIELGPR
ncbi:metallophosphoesterase family protein [Niabella terrae]